MDGYILTVVKNGLLFFNRNPTETARRPPLLAKGWERKIRDLDQVKCIKDEECRVLVHEKDLKDRWTYYDV